MIPLEIWSYRPWSRLWNCSRLRQEFTRACIETNKLKIKPLQKKKKPGKCRWNYRESAMSFYEQTFQIHSWVSSQKTFHEKSNGGHPVREQVLLFWDYWYYYIFIGPRSSRLFVKSRKMKGKIWLYILMLRYSIKRLTCRLRVSSNPLLIFTLLSFSVASKSERCALQCDDKKNF